MGGIEDSWKKACNNLGLEIENKKPISKLECKIINKYNKVLQKSETERKKFKECLEGEQRFDDGKLEFFTYQNGMRIAFEKMFAGNAQRVYHGKGPFIIKFKNLLP